jgi:hypothetical protein
MIIRECHSERIFWIMSSFTNSEDFFNICITAVWWTKSDLTYSLVMISVLVMVSCSQRNHALLTSSVSMNADRISPARNFLMLRTKLPLAVTDAKDSEPRSSWNPHVFADGPIWEACWDCILTAVTQWHFTNRFRLYWSVQKIRMNDGWFQSLAYCCLTGNFRSECDSYCNSMVTLPQLLDRSTPIPV